MLACVYQSRAPLPPPDPPDRKPSAPIVIDRVPGRARKMVATIPSPNNTPARRRLSIPKLSKAKISPVSDGATASNCDNLVSADKDPPRVTLVDSQPEPQSSDKVGLQIKRMHVLFNDKLC